MIDILRCFMLAGFAAPTYVSVDAHAENFWSWATLIAKEQGTAVVVTLIACMALVAIVWISIVGRKRQ